MPAKLLLKDIWSDQNSDREADTFSTYICGILLKGRCEIQFIDERTRFSAPPEFTRVRFRTDLMGI